MLIDLSRVRVSGPLSAFATGFADHMTRQGYSPQQARFHLLLLNHLSNWLASEGLDVGELCAKEVERFQRSRHEAGYSFLRSIRAMQPILGYLRGLGTAPAALLPPASGVLEAALARYRGYLILERGIKDASASRYIELMRPFLQTKVLPDGLALDLRSLTAADVISFVVTKCSRLSPGTAGLTVTALRSLLGFLYVDGAIDRSLVSAVPTVPGRRLTGLPKGLAADQVQRLLASCDTSTRSGCRDLAVLTMLVRLGLRAGEVAKLQLEHIDWRGGEIVIAHSKGNRSERLPLPADVGEAIAAYLRHGRPASTQGRTVFARITAPHHALTTGAVTQIVRHAGERCGFEPIHAHRLRHTAATLMLRGGASLPEIGQLLRHRNAITTSIYAKVDRSPLAGCRRMNALRKALADYFVVRRALGFKLYRAEKPLSQFLTFVEDRGEDHLTTEAALAWATLPKRGRTWAFARLSVVRRFAKHLRGIDPATEVPPTHLLVQQKGRATPYLYSESDIAALIAAAGTLRTPHRVATFRTLIALLAVTGMRVGEAIGLDRDDFDPVIGLLTIRNAKFGKSRQLPLHPSTVAALVDYLRRGDRPTNSSNTPALLVTTVGTRPHYIGTRPHYMSVQPVFRQIVDRAGLKPRSASCRPRLHDLRHGFAVNTILDGYRDGREPGNRIALLSTYLGHVDPVSTYWYLSAAPELLTLVGDRLERHLGGAA